MTFTPDTPQSGQTLGATQPIINANFQQIDTVSAINHVAFNATGEGKHKFLQMPEQSSAPTTAANEGGLYAKVANSSTNLFWRQESSGTEVQLTTSQTPSKATNGYTFLPGDLLIQWGQKATPGTSGQVTFPITFGAAPYSLSVSIQRASGNQSVTVSSASVPTATTFNYLSSSAGSTLLYWMAIGPAS